MEAIDPNSQKILMQIVASWVLIAVFAMSALAFICMIFGIMRPDSRTRNYLFGVFGLSAMGLVTSGAADFLRTDFGDATKAIARDVDREAAAENVQLAEVSTGLEVPITVYTQISKAEDKNIYAGIKSKLNNSRFLVPAVDVVNHNISRNQIRFCNPDNKSDAEALKSTLEATGINEITVTQIQKCSPQKNKNILELWVQAGE